ncbi:ferredoxin [Arthrobacter crystallopoietes BAB-32]|uniref:Ferredoxin n=1 Tax=Arthrobacter crystallopoietes BAB-32 TaxID=1246476 RepID=N1V370_9MICC|nr:2Fe-2S iron-sulfur cluster-binding protein [Arthrobacter crystallopoietes]EMY34454.1 ferredoxin [Arthrobacter crystallopoietes BAB-32]
MAKVSFHHGDGAVDIIEADDGISVMRAAVTNGVAGIVGECGGQAMCATCHVYVREEYLEGLSGIGGDEDEMLDCTASPRDAVRSRLGCQLRAGEDFAEIEVDVPAEQS